jgi:chromosome segregation ATPase
VKRVIVRALAAIGLVPARRYHEVSRRANELTRDRDDWKKRATKLARRERTLEQQTRDLERQLKKQLRRQGRPADGRVMADVPDGDLAALQARLADTERALTLARDQLNAIEVKLEILEGAANVLDARTRVAPQRQPDKTGAAVS